MPYYIFKNIETEEVFTTDLMKISELQPFREAHPELELLPASPLIGDPIRLGIKKADPRLTEKLNAISKNPAYAGNKLS